MTGALPNKAKNSLHYRGLPIFPVRLSSLREELHDHHLQQELRELAGTLRGPGDRHGHPGQAASHCKVINIKVHSYMLKEHATVKQQLLSKQEEIENQNTQN